MSTHPPVTPERFDALIPRKERLWGLSEIANHLHISTDKARRLARIPDCPIYRPDGSGTFFAFAGDLDQWLRSKS